MLERYAELKEQLKQVENLIEMENERVVAEVLKEKGLKLGDKILVDVGGDLPIKCFLSGVFVSSRMDWKRDTVIYYVCFRAYKMKKDGTQSLHEQYISNRDFSKVKKLEDE